MVPTTLRRSLIACVACVIFTSCSSSSSKMKPSSTSAPADDISFTTSRILQLPGAVDLVERDVADGFYFVAQRDGLITRHRYGSSESDIVLDIHTLTTTDNERGLLGITFRQNRQKQWHLYVNYTDTSGNTQIDEYLTRVDGSVNAATRRPVLSVVQPYANHNGGGLAIGPDNMLYISLGDGGSANDPERRSQDLTTLLGKLLRINPEPSSTSPYSIPPDNPFVNSPNARPEIWSVGLRNPWRFTFASNGDLWIADVGQNTWEEINLLRFTGATPPGRGTNFGWSAFEGRHPFNADQQAQDHVPPIFEYKHENGACSISGAAVSSSSNMPILPHLFFFGDFCSGTVYALSQSIEGQQNVETVATALGNVTAVRATSRAIFVLTLDGAVSEIHTSQK